MSEILLKREQPLDSMSDYELIKWLGELCELWVFERHELSVGLMQIDAEICRTCKALLKIREVLGNDLSN